MNALQVNFVVHDFAAAIRFYSAMFARPPALLEPDCAEWVLSEPSARFTIVASGVSRCATPERRCWLPPTETCAPQLPLQAGRRVAKSRSAHGDPRPGADSLH